MSCSSAHQKTLRGQQTGQVVELDSPLEYISDPPKLELNQTPRHTFAAFDLHPYQTNSSQAANGECRIVQQSYTMLLSCGHVDGTALTLLNL